MRYFRMLTIVLLLGLLVGCKKNPLESMSPGDFHKLVESSEYRSVAGACADYYIRHERIKITRLSMVCSEFTRSLQLAAQKQGRYPNAKLEHFRDKALWKRWRSEFAGQRKIMKAKDTLKSSKRNVRSQPIRSE